MRLVVPSVLLIVALIHALPAVGVLGATKLELLYGIAVREPNLNVLLRHRAATFAMLAALLAYAAFQPQYHRLGLLMGLASVVSFLVFAHMAAHVNEALTTVVRVDVVALLLLVVGGVVHVLHPVKN